MPAFHAFVQLAIFGYIASVLAVDVSTERFAHAAFFLINGAFWLYAIIALIGFGAISQDLRAGLAEWVTSFSARAASGVRPAPIEALTEQASPRRAA